MLGARIEEMRKARGLSRAQLAAACGTSERTIANYERGTRQPQPDALAAICGALQVSADYLLGCLNSQPLKYSGIDPGRADNVAALCERLFDLAATDAAADYERDALPVYAEILEALQDLADDTDSIYAQIRAKYPAFTARSMTDKERAALAAAELSNDPAAIERAAGERAFDNKLRLRIETTGNYIFSLLSVSLYNILRSKPGADVPRLHRIITTGTDPGSSEQ